MTTSTGGGTPRSDPGLRQADVSRAAQIRSYASGSGGYSRRSTTESGRRSSSCCGPRSDASWPAEPRRARRLAERSACATGSGRILSPRTPALDVRSAVASATARSAGGRYSRIAIIRVLDLRDASQRALRMHRRPSGQASDGPVVGENCVSGAAGSGDRVGCRSGRECRAPRRHRERRPKAIW